MTLCTPADVPLAAAAVAPPAAATVAPPASFDAVLYPNRSLGRFGFHLLMAAIVLVSGALGAAFVLAGAWPVTGFLGLDVLLLYLAFRWNYRQGRRAEFIRLDAAGLAVRRVDPEGRAREWRFDANWVRITIDDPPRPDSQLILSSHGRTLVVGAFLSPEERLEVGRALRAALAAHRQTPDRDTG
jgi:uncharacterized membrane protein